MRINRSRKLVFQSALTLTALVIGSVGFSLWWQAQFNSRIDLGKQLIGRWAAEGISDGLSAGPPAVIKGGVTPVQGHCGIAWVLDGSTANVSVTNRSELLKKRAL